MKIGVLIVGLIVLVPLIASMDPIEIPRFARAILIFPVIAGRIGNVLFQIKQLFLFIELSLRLRPVQRFRSEISSTGCFLILSFHPLLDGFGNESRSCNSLTLFKLHRTMSILEQLRRIDLPELGDLLAPLEYQFVGPPLIVL